MKDNINELRLKIDEFIQQDKMVQYEEILELIDTIADNTKQDEFDKLCEYLFKNIQGNLTFIMDKLLENESIDQRSRFYGLYLVYVYMEDKDQRIYFDKYLKAELNNASEEYIEYILPYFADIFQNYINPDYRKQYLGQFIDELSSNNIEEIYEFAEELDKENLKQFVNILSEYRQNTQESDKTQKQKYLDMYYKIWSKEYYKKNRDIGEDFPEVALEECRKLSAEGRRSEILESDSMDYLWQLYYADELLEEHKRSFEQIIAELEKKDNIVTEEDMQPYVEKVKNAKELNLEELNGFIRNIAKMRISNGIIDEKYCDYILEQKVIKRTELSKRCPRVILRRAFEDKARHVLKEKGIKDYLIKMEDMNERLLGSHSREKREIKYNNNYNIRKFGSRSIEVLYHEIQHADKAQQIEEHNINRVYRLYDNERRNIKKE